MKFGILLPTRWLLINDPPRTNIDTILSMAKTAESAGLDSVWVGDSLTAKPRLEPLTVLASVASITKRIRLGTAVMLGALRHPVLLAHAASTLDLISGGRLVLGLGVGGAFTSNQRQEWLNAGVNPATRATRFEEVVELVKRLTRGETVNYKGRHFTVNDVKILPVSPHPEGVHILLASHWRPGKPRQFLRAAKFGDGYISISDHPDEFLKVTSQVKQLSKSRDRNFDAMERVFYMTVNINDDREYATKEADEFLQSYYGLNIWNERWGPYGSANLIAKRIKEYEIAGVQTMVIRFAGFDQERQLESFLSKVLPIDC